MKYLKIIALLWLFQLPLCAQTLEESNAAMREFVQINNNGGDRAALYRALHTCYTGYVNVLNTQTFGAGYNDAHDNLKLLYPYLQNAAGFYSQNGDQRMATFFAKACVDVPKMNAFRDDEFAHDNYYPTIVYFAASNSFNDGDYNGAIKYYNEYLKTGETTKRKNAFGYLYKSCVKLNNMALASNILENAVTAYPNDFDILSMAINAAIESRDYTKLSGYIDQALKMRPGNKDLLGIQGQMYEDMRDYESALKVFQQLKQQNPMSLSITEHIALNTYNLGIMYNNKAALESNTGNAKKLRQKADEHFASAAKIFEEILLSDPTSVKYTHALAMTYSCLGNQKQLDATNFKLQALGIQKVEMNATPALVTYKDQGAGAAAGTPGAAIAAAKPARQSQTFNPADADASHDVPRYSDFARQRISESLKKWQEKDPYETVDEYKKRVNDRTQNEKLAELKRAAEQEYIRLYSHTPRYDEFKLMPYDAENQVFLIHSNYGELVLPVKRDNNEARIFESNWNGMQFKDAQYYIDGDSLCLATLTFVTPTGNSYKYDNQKGLEYIQTNVNVQLADVDLSNISASGQGGNRSRIGQRDVNVGISDVDENIPEAASANNNSFAVVIANENYQYVPAVPMAGNDGKTFAKYCSQTLGIPESNVRYYPDATLGSMINAMQDIRNIADAYSGDIRIVFYFAGHGLPDEATKDAYLLPVDADGKQLAVCYSLRKLYGELSSLKAKNVVVFLDACFSGTTSQGGSLMASARGVAIKPNDEAPQGNMVVFSAASGTETAYPYEEKKHGMFTYYLLKKLQESQGNATLKELADYITKNVKEKSVVVNRKPQTPSVAPSASVATTWQNIKLQ